MTSLLSQSSSVYISPLQDYVSFHWDTDLSLTVTIETSQLYMRSVQATQEDINSYTDLFSEGMSNKWKNEGSSVASLIKDVWAKRWKKNDPYSALAVFKNDTFEFIGHVAISAGTTPGSGELTFLFKKNYSRQELINEAIAAVVNEFLPATVEEGYKINGEVLREFNLEKLKPRRLLSSR